MDALIYNPHEKLRIKSEPLSELTELTQERIENLVKLMYEYDGIGLAAPQVGWNVKVFVMNVAGSGMVFINPEIQASGEIWEMEEGCLSIPGITGLVERPSQVKVKATDLNNKTFEFIDDGLAGRCALHEFDHLLGVLFIDKARHLYSRSKTDNL